jgi:tRNA pseudouridine38-40 synthase
MRIALGIEYDGSQYHGWQKQPGLHTVQESIEKALQHVSQNPTDVVCAGRTDTGVHGVGQVLHFDTAVNRNLHSWVSGTNTFLPKDICVRWAKDVPEDFHARYSAQARTYRYMICDEPVRPALFRGHVTWIYRKLNHERMAEGATCLIGEHDFSSFRASDCQSLSPMRFVKAVSVTRHQRYVQIEITANAFLHHMVRNIAGVLMAVGTGKRGINWVQEVLEAKDRRLGAETAPPYGLYFLRVQYPEIYQIPESDYRIGLL